MSRQRALIARRIVAVALALLPLAALLVAGAVIGPRLGAVLASHWSGGPKPDGFDGTWISFWTSVAIVTALAALTVGLIVAARGAATARIFAGFVALIGGIVALAWVIPALATASADRPADADLGGLLALLLLAVALGALVFVTLGSPVRVEESEAPDPSTVVDSLGPSDRLTWTGVTGSKWFAIPGAALLAVTIGCVLFSVANRTVGPLAAALLLGVLGLALASLGRVRLTIDSRGLRLSSTIVPIPLIRVSLHNIDTARAEQIDPLHWGGWGLRLSPRGIAYVTHRTGGLVVTRRRGSDIAVTIDHADAAARSLALLLDRQRDTAN